MSEVLSAKSALTAIRKLQARLDAMEGARSEPIAIVGIGCRFPGGVHDPASFWRLLCDGVDAITEVPPDRWPIDDYYDPDPSALGKMSTRWGAFLENIDRFDPGFFGIAPREAASMDPQQRLLLEVAWEALEDAGLAADRIAGTRTGVFVGIYNNDYAQLQLAGAHADAHAALGSALGIAPGRLSYLLDLQGPSMLVDTLCSSSAVAVHLACQSLRSRECGMALAGGVNLTLSPFPSIATSRLLALSPDGRCKSFDSRANGFVRGEGCGIVALKRLSDARADGDPVWALIRGSAVNQDGRSTGLTAPNVLAQQAVLRQALDSAGVKPEQVGYIEAHGTGTPLGDPIEVEALRAVYGRPRGEGQACALGSVKTNLGHLEASAGIAGLLKAVLAVRYGAIPPNLHFRQLNPRISLAGTPFTIPTALQGWTSGEGRRLAGVSALGMSGTNAHIIVEEADAPIPSRDRQAAVLLTLSAQNEGPLRELAVRYRNYLVAHPQADLPGICFTSQTGRTQFEHRLAVVAESATEAVELLDSFPEGRTAGGTPPKLAFLFTGQGAQYAEMGRELYEQEPLFRAALDRCAEIAQPLLDVPLLSLLFDPASDQRRIDKTAYTQVALFALEWSLAQVWMAWGVKPDFVLGHSLGEYVAACVAGAFSLEDALKLVAERGRLMQTVSQPGSLSTGSMATIYAAHGEVAAAIPAASVSIAAINAPQRTVISGSRDAVEAICAQFAGMGVETRMLASSQAWHSPLMDSILDEFERAAGQVSARPLALPLIANLTGDVVPAGAVIDARYWRRHMRETVQFARGIETLAARGCHAYLEIGPHPTLTVLGPQVLPDSGELWLPSLRQAAPGRKTMLESLGRLYQAGVKPDWKKLYAGGQRRCGSLPTYPFQRERFWAARKPGSAQVSPPDDPLLGSRLRSALPEIVFESQLSVEALPFLGDHRVQGLAVLPAAAIAVMARNAATQAMPGGHFEVLDMLIREPLVVPEDSPRTTQLVVTPFVVTPFVVTPFVVTPGENGGATFRLYSLEAERWRLHAEGSVVAVQPAAEPDSLEAVRQRCHEQLSAASFYEQLSAHGLEYGPLFRGLTSIDRNGAEALARVTGEEETTVLDACFQLLGVLLPEDGSLYLPMSIKRLRWRGEALESGWAHARLRESKPESELRVGDVSLYNGAGRLLLTAEGLTLGRLRRPVGDAAPAVAKWLHTVEWRAQSLPPLPDTVAPAGRWLLFPDSSGLAERLAGELRRLGQEASLIHRGMELETLDFRCRGVIYLSGLEDSLEACVRDPLLFTQALLAHGAAPPVCFVTQGAQSDKPHQAALWGFGAVLAREHPELPCVYVDLDPGLPAESAASALLANLLTGEQTETRRMLRGGMLYVERLVRVSAAKPGVETGKPVRLEAGASGELDRLHLAPMQRRSPGPGEIEMRVEATGLNFRDVLKALGMLPGQSGPPGFECAGTVVAVGAGVKGLEPGDRATAIATESFASYVTVRAALAARIPPNLSTVEAATLPVVFLTVLYALREVAGLRSGEKLLVHSAAGGVGLAAIQWAGHVGARLYGTVGSVHKRALLEAMGIQILGSSRQLPEGEKMRQAVGGEGVDVVLNALSGEAIERSLQLLRPGGRFIELGRRGIWSAEQVAAVRPDVAYHVVNLHEIAEREPELVGGWLRELMELFAAGTLRPLPVQTFSLKDAAQAFRMMAQGQHVGKLAVVMDGRTESLTVRADGAYLITGGRGGVGLALARWLVEQGARNLILASRRPPDEEQRERIKELREAGAQVTAIEVDVADYEALRDKLPPLRGVIHAAGVLDDGPLLGQDWERMSAVLTPKTAGALALDRLTAGQKLDFFILCSSAASVLGSAGQAAYAAGNAFLDSLAHMRRGRGEPALSINWGPVAEVGLASKMEPRVRAQWAAAGIDFLPRAALGPALLEASRTGLPQVAVLAVDWKKMQAGHIVDPLLSELVSVAPQTRTKSTLPLPEAVRAVAASVLGLAPENVPVDRPFQEMGLDSLMAVELRNVLARQLDRSLPATLVFDYPTVSSLVDYLAGTAASTYPTAPAQAVEVSSEAIAIIGMGCRLPGGVTTPEELWRLLAGGVDAIGEVPRERWDVDAYYDPHPATPGKMSSRWGGFLDGIDRFDAAFFGISPREAVSMDPQQRLLLEASWEALERAGIAPGRLGGSLTGVFVGISTTDYSLLQMRAADPAALDIYFGTGSAVSVAAGRLAYTLGLQGPCIALDTACSSSLTAVHLACQSLRHGECDLALAGGVNAILTPDAHINFSQAHMLALDGRCKSFDASADGYVRGEGCGMLVLKRVSDARRDGDPILAVVRGSAVNQDGRSNGLTAPNGPAQEAVIRAALHRAGIPPGAVGLVEAHGTGTLLGDPIEMQALGAVLAEGRAADLPVMVGSIKSNLGHLEAAAGAAGLIKVVLALQHGEIPPSLHFHNPNPHIAWEQLPVRVPTALGPWPSQYQSRIAGISGFGISGTNAHVVIEQAPSSTPAETVPDRPSHVLALSAKSPDAIRQLAHRYSAYLAGPAAESFADICHTANTGRSHFAHRLAIAAGSNEEAREKLALAPVGYADAPPKIAFLFTGQGAQYAGMGRQLYERQPAFRGALDRCAGILASVVDVPLAVPLVDLLHGGGELLRQTRYSQPALVALEWSLAELWRSWGIVPDAVLGHSVGECAAACVAGVLSLEDALRLAAARGRFMEDAAGRGAMATVFADAAAVAEALAALAPGTVTIAAINSPQETVISGEAEAVAAAQNALAAAGFKSRKLPVEYGFHSPLLDPVLDDFETAASAMTFRDPRLPLVSTLTGTAQDGSMNAAYWRRQAREPVQFSKAIETLRSSGHSAFVEIGPRPTLLAIGQRNVEDGAGLWLPSLRKEGQDWETILDSLARLYKAGAKVDWAGFDCGYARRRVVLPTYPFQRERYWIQPARRETRAPRMDPASMLGQRLNSPALDAAVFETAVSADSLDLLNDHRIFGTAIMPAAGYVTQALLAAKEVLGDSSGNTPGDTPTTLEEFTIHEAMILPEIQQRVVQVVVKPGDNASFQVHSREKSGSSWTLHATGKVTGKLGPAGGPAAAVPDLAAIRERCTERITGADFYLQARARHIEFGPSFQRIEQLWRTDGEALGQIASVQSAPGQVASQPGLIDACFQLLGAALPVSENTPVPVGFDRLRWHGPAEGGLWGYARIRGGGLRGDIQLFNESGVVLEIEGLHLKYATPPRAVRDWLYQIAWQPVSGAAVAPAAQPVQWLIYPDRGGIAQALQQLLAARGDKVVLVQPGEPLPDGSWHGVVYLSALDITDPANQEQICGGALEIFSTLAVSINPPPRVWLVTTGSQSGAAPAQSSLWGLGRSVRWEHPELWGGLVDLDAAAPAATQAEALLAELWTSDGEREVAYRDGKRHVSRLVRFAPPQPALPWRLREDGAYLVTGGLGALGLEVARRMVERGARHLVLMGRSKPSGSALSAIDALRQSRASVRIVSADVTREAELAEVLKQIAAGPAPLRGIVHAAGLLDDGLLANLDWDRFQRVLAPKVLGAWNLHLQTRSLPLDFFVLFSSLTAAFGAPGQANYAAANAFLVGLAQHRHRLGLPALSLNWAPWAEVGMAAQGDGKLRRWAGQGLFALKPEEGLDAFEMLAGESAASICVAHADWPRFLEQFPSELAATTFAGFDRPAIVGKGNLKFRKQLQEASGVRRKELLLAHVRDQVAAVLNVPQAGPLPIHQGFFDLGMDSLMAMEVRNRLQESLGLSLPATVVLENGTIAALAAYLSETLAETMGPLNGADPAPDAAPDEELDALLAEIESLPENEIDRELAEGARVL